MDRSPGLPNQKTLAAFAAFVLVSGGGSVTICFTYGEIQPFYGAMARFAIGAVVFWTLAIFRKLPIPKG
jgi:hypothetical protein